MLTLVNKSEKIRTKLTEVNIMKNKHMHIVEGEIVSLSLLKRGEQGKVISLQNDNKALRRRLLDMGITKGVKIEIKKIAPLGDPIDVKLRGYELCLRKADMAEIMVEKL